jgi:hypothetical protein
VASLTFVVLRPDDLVVLEVEAVNLRLDETQAAQPLLVRTSDPGDALLVVRFPTQSIVELAQPENAAGLAAGDTPARAAGGSRLVFRLPEGVDSIPYTVAGVLDWSALEPVLAPVAAVARGDSPIDPPAITQPGETETALEMPYRLLLSPGPGVSWTSAANPIQHGSRTELWHARLAHPPLDGEDAADVNSDAPATARAIWSPDYAGPGVIPDSLPGNSEPGFQTAMNRSARHQLVALTSDFRNIEVPFDFELGLPFFVGLDLAERYVPDPVDVDIWLLSALGGWLRVHGAWGGQEKEDRPRYGNGKIIDLSSWRHLAAQGRDHFVELVYEGSLFPLGHRAAWVTITERRFETDSATGPPVARLRQFDLVLVRRPFRAYEPGAYPGEGREMPLRSGIQLLTHVTPHVLGPDDPAPDGQTPRIVGTEARWVRTQDGADFPFPAVGTDADGGSVPFSAALIWVPDSDTSGPDAATKLAAIQAAYAAAPPSPVTGESMAFAPGTTPGARDAALPTFSISFDAHIDGENFVPTLARAQVRLQPVEAIVGPGTPVTVKPFPAYVSGDFDAHAGVFAELVGGADVKLSADKAGGIATPNVTITGVGRSAGVVAGDLSHVAQGLFDPKQVFAAADAQLFGSIRLFDLLPIDGAGLSDAANAPRLHSYQEAGPAGPQAVTALEWTPRAVTQPPSGLLKVDNKTTLKITGRIVQPVLPPGGPPPTPSFSFDGKLSNFGFEIAEVVKIGFNAFAFSAPSGKKLEVSVDMGGDPAVEFLGPLAFVTGLADKIPAGIFGPDGPSIDLEPDHVTVGASVAVPPLSIGVFSLQHLAIDAGVTLPFLDGNPLVDVAFAKRDKPFLLTVTLFGGGGFVHVQLDSGGVRMVEGALEFGGAFALDIGVASGGVQVMAGIYFKLSGPKSDLAGFVDLFGEVSVLGIISVSVEFNLTLSYESPGKARGRATLIVAVHIAFVSKSVELSVERSFGSASGDPSIGDVMTAGQWATYAKAFA